MEENRKIYLITGHYGSGKTNFAVNLALDQRKQGKSVTLVDLDIVNPYFRTADSEAFLRARGIKPLVPQYANTNVEIPSLPEALGKLPGMLLALLIGGLIAALLAFLIGLPVLRLKSDYLAIATLGFAEILRAFFQWNALGPITNGSNLLKSYPEIGGAFAYLLLAGIFIAMIILLVNSTYGRAFIAIRDDEVAAEAMGINLAKHKRMAFIISSFFAGVGGGMLAMYMGAVQALSFKSTMTYEILLIVVIGGIGSISGSVLTSFLYVASLEWLLRGLDSGTFLGINAPGIFKNGFRMAVVSVIIMVVVLFFRKGIMGDKELPDLFRKKPSRKMKKEVAAK